ncbi:MAG: pseudouridine synthase [Bacteroidota bacterium]
MSRIPGKKRFSKSKDGFEGKSNSGRKKREEKASGFREKRKSFAGKKSFGKPAFKSKYRKKTYPTATAHAEEKPVSDLVRLNKYIANAGICSRREADELIAAGAVSVNGKVITEMGYKVKPGDVVNYGGQTLRQEKMQYVLLNKPKDYITTMDDPEGRKHVMELVRNACRERIYPVGRLDRSTTGVLLFTNDGELTKRLTHPRYGIKKIYHVTLDQNLKHNDLQKIAEGLELEDGFIKPDAISYTGEGKNEVGIELHSGRNRIVRRIFEHLGYRVTKLDRVFFAGLTKKNLERGRWRHLTEKEVAFLKMTAG